MKKGLFFSMLVVCVFVYLIGDIMNPVFQHHGFWIDSKNLSATEHKAISLSGALACLALASFVVALLFGGDGNGKPVYYKNMPRGVKHHIKYRTDSLVGRKMTFVVVQDKCGDKPKLVFFDFELDKDMQYFVVMPEPQRQLHLGISPQTQIIGV